MRARAMGVLEFMGLTAYSGHYAFGLPYGVLKKIEIARTLMCSPRLIILDEPAAGLNDTETVELAGSSAAYGMSITAPSCWSSTTWGLSWTCATIFAP